MPWNAAYWGNLLGLAAYVVGVLSLVGGALLSGRLGARWAGRRWLFETHLWISWAVLVLGVAHGLLLWPRRGGATSLVAWWWPLGVSTVPLGIAVAPFAVYVLAAATASYYARRQLGFPLWRWLHGLAYPALAVLLWHGVDAGPDSWNPVLRAGYGVALLTAVAGVGLRIGSSIQRSRRRARRA
jgi:methionine sulfoxide reductase heme-binding subunit